MVFFLIYIYIPYDVSESDCGHCFYAGMATLFTLRYLVIMVLHCDSYMIPLQLATSHYMQPLISTLDYVNTVNINNCTPS